MPDKIRRAWACLDKSGHPEINIAVDGNVSFDKAVRMRAAGANVFVGGTSSIFQPSQPICDNVTHMHQCVQ